jgi:hypothetical protein
MSTNATMPGGKARKDQEGGADDADDVRLGGGGPSQEALPVATLGDFGDVVRAAGGVLPPVVKGPAPTAPEKPPALTYSRISTRPAVQLMSHDEAMKILLCTKQLHEILKVVEKHQDQNLMFNS